MTNFIIYSSPRCGSNWICDLLNNHTNVTCLGEIFHNIKLITGADNSFDTKITEGFEIKKKNDKPFEYFHHLRSKRLRFCWIFLESTIIQFFQQHLENCPRVHRSHFWMVFIGIQYLFPFCKDFFIGDFFLYFLTPLFSSKSIPTLYFC